MAKIGKIALDYFSETFATCVGIYKLFMSRKVRKTLSPVNEKSFYTLDFVCIFKVLRWYTDIQMYTYPTFLILILNKFVREPIKLEKQMIAHLKALICGYIIFEEHICTSIRGCHALLRIKHVFLKRSCVIAHGRSLYLHSTIYVATY